MNLYNSATQSIEPLVIERNHVGIYVCGVTPYDTTHSGHAFTPSRSIFSSASFDIPV